MTRTNAGSAMASLMIVLAVSMSVALSALRLIAQSSDAYRRVEQIALIDDQAAYALDSIARTLQQAGHVNVTLPMAAVPARPFEGAVKGFDDSTVATGTVAADMPMPGGHLGSDMLIVRVAGDPAGGASNCTGFAVPAASAGDDYRGVSIFHVALDSLNEPELRCKYHGSAQWSSQALATGVASFQVLFGIDTDLDGVPNDFVSASRVAEIAAATLAAQPSIHTRVVAVEVALLMRSPQAVQARLPLQAIDMFGRRYSERHGANDPGTRIEPGRLKPDRLHRRYDAVIFLNNSLRPDA